MVVGGGQSGTEAPRAAARKGAHTHLLKHNNAKLGQN
ncbi:FAD-dependent oxidoreductase [Neisseria sp. P0008.S010]